MVATLSEGTRLRELLHFVGIGPLKVPSESVLLDRFRSGPYSIKLRSHGGRVVVTQRRSEIGTPPDQRKALKTLGLGRIGRSCVVAAGSSSSEWGNVAKVGHLVWISPLPDYIPKGRNFIYTVGRGGVSSLWEQRQIGGSLGEMITFGNGEYLQTDQSRDRRAVYWSSDATAQQMMEAVGRIKKSSRDAPYNPTVYVELDQQRSDGRSGSGNFEEVLEYISVKDPPVALLSVEIGRVSAFWNMPAIRTVQSGTAHAEIGVIYPSTLTGGGNSAYRILNFLMFETTSSALRDNADLYMPQLRRLI